MRQVSMGIFRRIRLVVGKICTEFRCLVVPRGLFISVQVFALCGASLAGMTNLRNEECTEPHASGITNIILSFGTISRPQI